MNPEDQFNQVIAKRVREARENAGLSQKEMGKKIGLSEVGYGHYERGTHPFAVWQLFQIARILHRPVKYFLGLDTELGPDEGRALALYRQIHASGLGNMALELLETMAKPRS